MEGLRVFCLQHQESCLLPPGSHFPKHSAAPVIGCTQTFLIFLPCLYLPCLCHATQPALSLIKRYCLSRKANTLGLIDWHAFVDCIKTNREIMLGDLSVLPYLFLTSAVQL